MSGASESQFAGCLLGLFVGDALGAHFEFGSIRRIASDYTRPEDFITRPPRGEWHYTDDTQMAIGVAETLVACGEIDLEVLCQRFAANYDPVRGYGPGAMAILQAIRAGEDHELLAETLFPGGSFGNGAAMRVAPIGIAFRDDFQRASSQAHLSSLPTHLHPLGIEGAQLVALAVALASRENSFHRDDFFDQLIDFATHVEYSGALRRAAEIVDHRDLALFGNGIAATDSVVTAIASFALTPDDYVSTIGNVILLGGDTDTMAAMAGAISGARLGQEAIPSVWLDALEDNGHGRTYIEELAKKLHQRFSAA